MIEKAWTFDINFEFYKPAKTSRNILTVKRSHFIFLEDEKGAVGIGECAPIYGLSIENEFELLQKISEVIYRLNHRSEIEEIDLENFPALQFALECAQLDLIQGGSRQLFDTDFSKGSKAIPINGLVWMANIEEMKAQVNDKIEQGFQCVKIKIGSLDFETEVNLLKEIRQEFGHRIELRLDANGAFDPSEALNKLEMLSKFDIHSIEQPIKQGQWEAMSKLCKTSPIPIALDEELIGVKTQDIPNLLDAIHPPYIILKPTLIGGFTKSETWIKEAEKRQIKWWATSALESNIGLNDIAQWVSSLNTDMHQGLGTGQIYKNNIPSPLYLEGEHLFHKNDFSWDLSVFSV